MEIDRRCVCVYSVIVLLRDIWKTDSPSGQSRTQSPQALWPAVGGQENFFIGYPVTACVVYRKIYIPAVLKSQFPRVSPGDQLLASKFEDSG